MKEKERGGGGGGEMRQKKKGVKKKEKKFQCGNRTRDLLIYKHLHCVAIVSPHMCIYDQTSCIYIILY